MLTQLARLGNAAPVADGLLALQLTGSVPAALLAAVAPLLAAAPGRLRRTAACRPTPLPNGAAPA